MGAILIQTNTKFVVKMLLELLGQSLDPGMADDSC